MNPLRKFHLDLQACELEDRLLPVIANLGVVVLTSGGYLLMIRHPAAVANPGGSLSVAAAVSTSISMTSLSGIFNTQSGNIPGSPSLAAPGKAGSSANAGAAFTVGSPAGDPATASIPLVTRNTIANDAPNPPPRIGRLSEDRSPILPLDEWHRDGVPQKVPDLPVQATLDEPSSRKSAPSALKYIQTSDLFPQP
jgi:hypothetical protein